MCIRDSYYWGRPAGSEPYKISDITARDAFTVYLEALRKYPDVVIKDRLDGTDILWDVVQPPDSFNAKSFNFVYTFSENTLPLDTSRLDRLDDSSYIKTAVPAKAYYSAANTPINSAADMLLWRTGAYLITFWVLLLFWSKNRMGRLWWAALPMLANAAGSMLVLYHQSFRYVYFVQVSVLAPVSYTHLDVYKRQVQKICKKALWLEHGHMRMLGDADAVCGEYMLSLIHI